MDSTERIALMIREKFAEMDDLGVIEISPSSLAEAVYLTIDPNESSPLLVRHVAILELRQRARAVCRERQKEVESEAEQAPTLFEFALQPRYPATRNEHGEVYVLRQHLTLEERNLNIARLRSEAEAKMTHANALQAETDHLVRQGALPDAA